MASSYFFYIDLCVINVLLVSSILAILDEIMIATVMLKVLILDSRLTMQKAHFLFICISFRVILDSIAHFSFNL